MGTDDERGVFPSPLLWLATVRALYDFETSELGATCQVIAQTAFEAWRKAEPALGVAKEHIELKIIGPATATAKSRRTTRRGAR